jgi:hypothetical protein
LIQTNEKLQKIIDKIAAPVGSQDLFFILTNLLAAKVGLIGKIKKGDFY